MKLLKLFSLMMRNLSPLLVLLALFFSVNASAQGQHSGKTKAPAAMITHIDRVKLNDFAAEELKAPVEKYLLFFRIASDDPETLESISDKFNIGVGALEAREQEIKRELNKYLERHIDQTLPSDEEIKVTITKEEIEQVEMLGKQPEKIVFDERTIDLFDRYIRYNEIINPSAAFLAELVLPPEKNVTIKQNPTAKPIGFTYGTNLFITSLDLEYDPTDFRNNMISFLIMYNSGLYPGILEQKTDVLAKMAIKKMVKNIGFFRSDDLRALASKNGLLGYLENKINSFKNLTEQKMDYMFVLDTFLGLAKIKGRAYLFDKCNINALYFMDTELRIRTMVQEASMSPVYREKFLNLTKGDREGKLKELVESEFVF